MRRTTVFLALAALAGTASCLAADEPRQEGVTPVPAEILCRDGKPVVIRLIMSEPGMFTLQLPPDLCARAAQHQAPSQAPRAPASSPRLSV